MALLMVSYRDKILIEKACANVGRLPGGGIELWRVKSTSVINVLKLESNVYTHCL